MSNKFGIIIPHYESKHLHGALLHRCLKSIEKHEPELLSQIMIVDDASPCDSLDEIKKKFPVSIMRNIENLGFAKTVNKGIRALKDKCEYLLLLNNDVELCTPFQTRIDKIFTQLPQTAVVGNLLLYPTGRVQSAGFGISIEYKLPFEYEKGHAYAKSQICRQSRFQFGVTGAMQFLRTAHLDTIGLYDEKFTMGYEDVEYCFRSWMKNRHVFYDSSIYGLHSEASTRGFQIGPREIKSYEYWKSIAKDEDIYQVTRIVEELNRKSIK